MSLIFIAFGIFNCFLLFYVWIYSVKNYKKLSEIIPIHFNFEGKPDGFGNKKWFWLLPSLASLLFIVINWGNFYPESANYVVEITEKNKDFQYILGRILSQVLIFVLLSLFFCIQEYTVKLQENEYAKSRIPIWMFIILLFFIIMTYTIVSASNK